MFGLGLGVGRLGGKGRGKPPSAIPPLALTSRIDGSPLVSRVDGTILTSRIAA